ncbi:MAG TPA: hypothetical protein VHM64_14415, partial [Candidatus Binatia bacterium]|nr:hypothetical protein [Candidatus Binatia bacterium]
ESGRRKIEKDGEDQYGRSNGSRRLAVLFEPLPEAPSRDTFDGLRILKRQHEKRFNPQKLPGVWPQTLCLSCR